MRAVLVKDGKGPVENLYIGETEKPVLKPEEVLVKARRDNRCMSMIMLIQWTQVAAFGLNRMDLVQRVGKYPVPAGASEILGVEFSGVIAEVAPDVTAFSVGDEVLGLVGGVSGHITCGK